MITVAICTRNRRPLLEKAIRSVLAQAGDDLELLIVDNGSTDDTPQLIADLASTNARIRYVAELNVGISGARNTALRQAKGEWVIFLDDDAQALPGWFAGYQKFFSQLPEPDIAVVGGAVIPEFETPPPYWMNGPQKLNYGEKSFRFTRVISLWECNCAYHRETTLAHGAFDVQLGPRGHIVGFREGADLNLRLQSAGHQIWWLGGAAIQHLVRSEKLTKRQCFRFAFYEGYSIGIMRLKFRSGPDRLAYVCSRILIGPFHCALNVLVGALFFPFNKETAAKKLLRATLIAGQLNGTLHGMR